MKCCESKGVLVMTPPSSCEPRSLELAHELASGLLAQLDANRYPELSVPKNRWVKHSGERLEALPYIVSGRLDAVLQLGGEGTQVIPVTFGTGEIALLSVLFADAPIHGALLAAEALRVRWLPVRELESVLRQDTTLLLLLVRFLALRLREVRARERAWLERGVHQRVCSGLGRVALESAPTSPGATWWVIATHEHLAQRCGVSRPKLSLALKQLEQTGVLRLCRGRIELLDYPALTAGM
jgi:CRP-like cAMP-binding protein